MWRCCRINQAEKQEDEASNTEEFSVETHPSMDYYLTKNVAEEQEEDDIVTEEYEKVVKITHFLLSCQNCITKHTFKRTSPYSKNLVEFEPTKSTISGSKKGEKSIIQTFPHGINFPTRFIITAVYNSLDDTPKGIRREVFNIITGCDMIISAIVEDSGEYLIIGVPDKQSDGNCNGWGTLEAGNPEEEEISLENQHSSEGDE